MEKLLSFLFLGILGAEAYHLILNLIYVRFFATATAFQTYWFVPMAVLPALLLAGFAFALGFFRPGAKRGHDLAVIVMLAAMVWLTVPASYSCRLGCF